eukprot:9195536-Alexandrium_andersonii.AAC.1
MLDWVLARSVPGRGRCCRACSSSSPRTPELTSGSSVGLLSRYRQNLPANTLDHQRPALRSHQLGNNIHLLRGD